MNHEPLPAQGPVDVNVREHIGYCPVCETNRPSLPEPAEGTCAYCYNHLMKPNFATRDEALQSLQEARKVAKEALEDCKSPLCNGYECNLIAGKALAKIEELTKGIK